MVIYYYHGSVQFMDAESGYPVASLQVPSEAKVLLMDDHTILSLLNMRITSDFLQFRNKIDINLIKKVAVKGIFRKTHN